MLTSLGSAGDLHSVTHTTDFRWHRLAAWPCQASFGRSLASRATTDQGWTFTGPEFGRLLQPVQPAAIGGGPS
jgi:hypothetical protein